jgi:hypothetical protein
MKMEHNKILINPLEYLSHIMLLFSCRLTNMCIYIHTHTHTHACIHTHTHTCMHAYTHTHTHIHTVHKSKYFGNSEMWSTIMGTEF